MIREDFRELINRFFTYHFGDKVKPVFENKVIIKDEYIIITANFYILYNDTKYNEYSLNKRIQVGIIQEDDINYFKDIFESNILDILIFIKTSKTFSPISEYTYKYISMLDLKELINNDTTK